mgnify:CR=1 FL=1
MGYGQPMHKAKLNECNRRVVCASKKASEYFAPY